jgi:hypothetical protein
MPQQAYRRELLLPLAQLHTACAQQVFELPTGVPAFLTERAEGLLLQQRQRSGRLLSAAGSGCGAYRGPVMMLAVLKSCCILQGRCACCGGLQEPGQWCCMLTVQQPPELSHQGAAVDVMPVVVLHLSP